MQSFIRKITMSSIPNPNKRISPKLQNLITQLRSYQSSKSKLTNNNADVDDRGKVFSPLGLLESESKGITCAENDEMLRSDRAAVLVCLFEGNLGDFRVILTKRSSNLSTHSGEVSFPGGKAEEGDANDVETALREAEEEIGLDRKLVTVSTILDPFLSKHLLRVVPVIGILTERHAFNPIVNTAEVEDVFDAPLEMFLKDENRRSEEKEWMGSKLLVHYFDFYTRNKKYVIWGLTASILIRTASVVYQRPPSFFEQDRNIICRLYSRQ